MEKDFCKNQKNTAKISHIDKPLLDHLLLAICFQIIFCDKIIILKCLKLASYPADIQQNIWTLQVFVYFLYLTYLFICFVGAKYKDDRLIVKMSEKKWRLVMETPFQKSKLRFLLRSYRT